MVERCTESLADSDMHSATLAIDEFLDDLSNWYIRRSRRRFWKSTHDLDKHTAYATLYHVLVKLIKLLAPLTPFVTEMMYQNLVRAVQPTAYDSVHHCDWPDVDTAAVQSTLLDQMALTRQVTSLGLGARSTVNLKVRQPLAKALVHVRDGQETRPSPRSLPMSSTSKRYSLSPTKPPCYVSRCSPTVSSWGHASGHNFLRSGRG